MKADYGLVDRLLHRLALGSTATAAAFHEVERNRYLGSSPEDRGGHVFVTGLARAGTTILLRELHATGQFGSLRYADMPFVLAPNLWMGISGSARKDFSPVERAHGDGIAVNLDSPEAFDEVFWRVFHGKDYIRPHGLLPHRPGTEAIARYRDLMRLVLRRSGKSRYLAKGNNNILRLATLAKAMPDCTFLLVIREPLAHADSLLRQHRRSATNTDSFRRDYIRWLAHHEFGSDHRPFRFGELPDWEPDRLEYWLATWLACYRELEPVAESCPNVLVVPYERLCSEPRTWAALCERIEIEAVERTEIDVVARVAPDPEDRGLAQAVKSLHSRYQQLAERWLSPAASASTIVASSERSAKKP